MSTLTTTTTLTLPELYGKQWDAFFCAARISACEASTKAGKTLGAIVWLIVQALNLAPGASYLWLAPVHSQALMAYERMERMFLDRDPGQTFWSANRSTLVITLGKSRIYFKGSDRPDTIYGMDYAAAVIDEASRVKEEAWNAVRSTVTATRGPIRLIGNVKGRNNWFYRMARRAESGAKDMAYHKLIAADAVAAGVLAEEEIEQARSQMSEHAFRELYLAEPSDDGGNPFGMQHIAACVGVESDERACVYGVDLAKSIDWVVVCGLDSSGRLCKGAFERWQHEPWDRTEARILHLVGDTPALVDSTGVGDPIVERMQRTAPNIVGKKFTPGERGTKQQMMEGLAVAIQSRRVSYPDGVIRQELDTFEYEHTRTGVRYTAPEGLHDDCVCALALAVEALNQHRPVGVSVVGAPGTKRPAPDERPITEIYQERRKDPDYGFAPLGGGRRRW